ncbi:MAG: glycoside hydrolase family 88 protein [Labilibaculum sp.]|nr:glycoside hydrolase family 88 protein [Labilibaculum sp.]
MKKVIVSICLVMCVSLFVTAQESSDKYMNAEYIESVLIKTAKWQVEHPKRRKRNEWTHAVFYAGLFSAWQATQSQMMYDELMTMGNKTGWKPFRRWYHADDIAICQTYLSLYDREKRMEMVQPSLDTLARFVSESYPTKGIEVVKYWWADALFMAPPVLIKAGIMFGKCEYLKYNDQLYREAYNLLYNKKERLLHRDLSYTIKNDSTDKYEANGKPVFWARGNGWVLAGLVKIMKELPADYPERPFYKKLFKEMAKRIVEIQPVDGLWRPGLLDPDAYPHGEVSGSGLFCYALAYGVNSGLLRGKKYRLAAKKAWVGLNGCLNEEGRVGWVQGAAAGPSTYLKADKWELYGTGAFLLAGSEMCKMAKE